MWTFVWRSFVAGWAPGVPKLMDSKSGLVQKGGGGALQLGFGGSHAPRCNVLVRLGGVLGLISEWSPQLSVKERTGVSGFASQWR